MTNVNIFLALEGAFSPKRMQTYLDAAEGDQRTALQFYVRNARLGAAFHGPLQALEVALRNALHAQLEARYCSQWYTNSDVGLDSHAQDSVEGFFLRHDAAEQTPDNFVASMSLGFWVRLLGRGGRANGGRNANYDTTLWRPALRRVFPGHRRRDVHRRFDSLRQLRNRIAHHEPIFERDTNKDYDELLEAVGWISSDILEWIKRHSSVPDALQAPLSATIRF